jgi:dTDP-4-amino-4,6-dideoxygalactose transaminase
VFSFHATKFFNTFEGGAIVTNDDDLARTVRLMSNFGFAGYDTVVSVGTNGKMSEMAAVMGLTGLESLDEFVEVNYRNCKAYQRHLQGIPGLRLIPYDETERCNFQYIVVEVDEQVTGIGRDQLVEILIAENVFARRYFYPGVHNMEPYRTEFPEAWRSLPETERLVSWVLTLPTGTAVTVEDVAAICQILRVAVENGEEISAALTDRAGPPKGLPAAGSQSPLSPVVPGDRVAEHE